MIRIKYFASLSEALGLKSEALTCHSNLSSAQDIIDTLIARGEPWSNEFCGDSKILVAVNQNMGERDSTVKDGDEVAFFPPVTGG